MNIITTDPIRFRNVNDDHSPQFDGWAAGPNIAGLNVYVDGITLNALRAYEAAVGGDLDDFEQLIWEDGTQAPDGRSLYLVSDCSFDVE